MSQAEALYHLQDLDLRLLRCQKRLSEIQAILGDDKAVAAAQARVGEAQGALVPLRTSARNLELEIQSTQQKARATEDQLYSGRVKNTKEMQDMEHEIVALKKRGGQLEDNLLEVMMALEEGEAALTDAEAALSRALDTRKDEHRLLLDEQAELQKQVAALREQRETALKPVTPESLSLYNALRPKKHNQPVAVMQDETCAACGVEQTIAIVHEARRGQSLVTCLSCGRILLYKG